MELHGVTICDDSKSLLDLTTVRHHLSAEIERASSKGSGLSLDVHINGHVDVGDCNVNVEVDEDLVLDKVDSYALMRYCANNICLRDLAEHFRKSEVENFVEEYATAPDIESTDTDLLIDCLARREGSLDKLIERIITLRLSKALEAHIGTLHKDEQRHEQ